MAATRITLKDDGPLLVQGDFEILDSEGRCFDLAGRQQASLCRCGHSGRKPFCDGAHRAHGFSSTVVASRLDPPAPKPQG